MSRILSPQRYWITIAFVASLFLIISYQLLQLTVIRRDALLEIANRQHLLRVEVPPLRGQILDRNRKQLATNLKVPSVYAIPRLLGKTERLDLIAKLEKILDIPNATLTERLSRDKAFIWLKRKVSLEEAQKIKEIKSPALGILDEYKRLYPQGDLFAQGLGFTNIDNVGIEGIELFTNRELQGSAGERFTKRDALGREIKAFEMSSLPSIDGNKVVLTIDQHIQFLTERALERAYTTWKAQAAWAIVMNPQTGEILAMANRPNFDPNLYSLATGDMKRNRVITDMYEPGSIFKIVTASAALNENVVTPEQLFFCENGQYRYGSRVLHDVHAYGELTFEEVIIKSSNIGTVKIASLMKPTVFQSYIEKFGFGRKTGIDLAGEASGFTRPPSQWSNTSPYNIPIGHEILVTSLQNAVALSVIANGGKLVQPYVLSKIEDQAGVVLHEKQPVVKQQVIRPEVAQKMREILVRVVEEGTGKRAHIDGISVGGKTGTAQKVLPNGRGYSKNNYMSSFLGFAPADNPMLVMAIVLDDPKPSYYGGTVAAPVFQEVVEPALLHMGYVPSDAKTLNATGTPSGAQQNAISKTPSLMVPAHQPT